MDAMKALASLDLVTARGLDSSEQGPQMLSNSVRSLHEIRDTLHPTKNTENNTLKPNFINIL